MTLTAKNDISETVKILARLDQQSLLLIDSGARLLAARGDMEKDAQREQAQKCEGR